LSSSASFSLAVSFSRSAFSSLLNAAAAAPPEPWAFIHSVIALRASWSIFVRRSNSPRTSGSLAGGGLGVSPPRLMSPLIPRTNEAIVVFIGTSATAFAGSSAMPRRVRQADENYSPPFLASPYPTACRSVGLFQEYRSRTGTENGNFEVRDYDGVQVLDVPAEQPEQ